MSRQFPDTSGITLAVGSAGVLDGAWSFAAIVKQTTRSTQSLISQQASGGNRGGLWLTSAGLLQASSGAGNSATFGITLPLNVWALVAITRVAGPNRTPRGHMYRYDTGVWAHANGNAALDNDTTAITHIELGRSFSDWFYIGLMANAGAWDRVLSDADVEGLELALQAWVDSTPVALWPLNQTSTATAVQDIIGAADQTSTSGTSVSADEPAGWSYTLGGGTTVVTKNISTTWNAAAVVTDPVPTTWNVASVVAKPVGSTWNVAGQVVKNAATTWDLAGSISKPVATAWDVATSVSKNNATTWNVASVVAKPVATSWDVAAQGQVSRSVASSWGVNALTGMSAATTWSIATQAALSVATAWDVAAQVAKSAATGWSVEDSPTAGLIVRPDTGTVTRPDTGIVIHLLTVVVRLYTGIVSRP